MVLKIEFLSNRKWSYSLFLNWIQNGSKRLSIEVNLKCIKNANFPWIRNWKFLNIFFCTILQSAICRRNVLGAPIKHVHCTVYNVYSVYYTWYAYHVSIIILKFRFNVGFRTVDYPPMLYREYSNIIIHTLKLVELYIG